MYNNYSLELINTFTRGRTINPIRIMYLNNNQVTASPQYLQSSTEIDFNIIRNTHDINCINISVSDENETNWDTQESPSSPISKSIVQHDGISAHSEKKSRGRKRKCGKTKNLGIFSQSSSSLTQKQIFSKNELDLYVSAAKHRIQIQEVLTDVHDSRCLEGWYFKNSRDVQIKYTLDGDLHTHIQLNHLRKNGFSLPDQTRKILLKLTLERLVLDASAATMSEHSIQIKNIQSDDENCDTSIESETWTYYDSAKVYIHYTVDGQNEHRMRLNNLLQRGFEIHEKNMLKYYSFLQLKMELRKYCHIHRVQYQDAFNNKTAFEEALLSVHDYYQKNPDTAIKENIEKGRGPSDFDEREELEKLYYYGRGKIKYYRWSDMGKTIQNEYGQTVLAKFSIDPSGNTISEEAFERFLSEISKDITHNAKRNRVDLHEEYVGPQCYEDRTNLEKLKYNVLYRETNRKQTVLPAPSVTHIVDKFSELKETVSNCSFSIRTCQSCNKIRVVGQRAAEKYMLSSYKYGGTTKRLKITCDRFVKLTCDTPSDLTPLNREVIEMNKTYIAYSNKNTHSFWGFILETKQVNENKYFEVDVKTFFGQRDESISDSSNHGIHWIKGISFEKYIIGTLNNRGRFIPGLNGVQFEISILKNDPREAKCSQPFHDTNMHTNDFQNIYTDPDNIESRLIFSSLIAVKNIHSVLDNVKILHCIKCNKQCSGFENLDEITILENGKMEKLSQRNDADLYNAVHSSKMIKEIDLTLSKKFRGSNIYKQITDKSVSSICTNCERFYELDENLDVVHIDAQNEIVQSQDSQQNSQNSLDDFNDDTQNQGKQPTLQLNQINPLGPENLFSLNLVNDHQFEFFVSRLTRAEVMCISPLLLCISVLRCRATQIPFSKGGSIAYPLLNPMETKTLPWFDFKNMPIIIVYRDDPNEKYRSEAKVNLNNIIIVKEWMETLITYQGIQRTQNRLVGELFFQFDNDNFRKLKEQLNNESNKYVIPKGIRELKIAEEDEKEPLTKELVSNWLKSNFHYGKAVLFGLYKDLSEEVKNDKSISPLDEFWTELEQFSYESLRSKIKMLQLSSNSSPETQLYKEWIDAGTVVTADTIARYAESMNYLNKVESVDTYDTSYFIFEEFQIMKTNFTNDLGLNQIDTGGTIDYCEDHPDTIVERNLKDTKLDRRLLQGDKNNPAPEWENSYLQLAFPDIFLTGDAALDQKRPVPLFSYKSQKKCREEYIRLLALQKGVQDKPHFLFLLLNLLKKEDANQAAGCILREVDLTTITLPTEDALRNEVIEKKSNMLLQYTPLIRDSVQFWKKQQKEAEALKRDMEYMDPVSRPGTTPIYASLFRTMAPPYNGIPSIHKLFTDDLTQLNNPTKRKQQALIHPTDVEWVISFLAELDVLYFRKIRYNSEWFVARNEHGANGNPHWHSVLFSQDYGQLIWRLKTDIEKKFEKMLTDRSSTGQFADQEKNEMQKQIMLSFKKSQEKIIDFFRGSYSNWNPAFTSDGKLADETYGTSDISNLSLTSLIDDALMTGDFSQLDKLYCDIILTCCRHITHTGKNGLPSKKDYCYKESSKIDKEKSTKEKTVYKIKSVCKRRKPQPVRSKPAIYQDPHDKKFVQLSFESNDGNFNGADPFLILNNLGNADCKALIPSIFMKCPKIVISEDRLSVKLVFYHHDSDDGCTYVLKYGLKPAIKAKPDNKILAEVIERYTYRNPDDQNAQNAENDPNILKPKMIRAMYNQVAVQHHVCLFQAQHVNINLPQILKNYHVENVNCLGRRTLKKNANDSNSSDSNNELYNTTKIKEFDERKNITDKSQTKLGRENVAIINAPLSLRTKHDLFKYEIDLNTGKYKVKIKNRINPTTLAYNAIGFTPHTTMGQARPNGKQFPTFCKKMCLTNSKYDQIETTVRQGLEEKRQELGLQVPAEDQAVQDEYWVDEFFKRFPDFEGLEPAYKHYITHYTNPGVFDSDDDADGDSELDITYRTEFKSDSNKEKGEPSNAKVDKDQYYQNPADKLYAHSDMNNIPDIEMENQDMARIDVLSENYLQSPTLEEDCRVWAKDDVNLDSVRLPNQIEAVYQQMLETKGKSEKELPENPDLTVKQQLVNDILTEFVEKKVKKVQVDPLRLFVIGIPGTGKTFAFQVAITGMIYILGDDWTEHLRLACPTGSVSYHMGFGAKTIHSTFIIEVGKVGEKIIEAGVKKIQKLVKQNPENTIMIIFDECGMIARDIFGAVCNRLLEAHLNIDELSFVFFGDPAQCEPVGGYPMYSTEPPNKNKKNFSTDLNGMINFREIMNMPPVKDFPFYKEREKLREKIKAKKKLSNDEITLLEHYEQEYGKFVYSGSYRAVYLDEVKRTDGSVESSEFIEINTRCRYGKYTFRDLNRLAEITATEKDIQSPEWKEKKTTDLVSYHFHNEGHPNRTNVDTSNARNLVLHADKLNEPIMVFKAVHAPEGDADVLAQLSSNEFQGLSNNLYMISGAPIIITHNINASVSLYNGARATFVGPLYLPKKYIVTDFNILTDAEIDSTTLCTTKQISIKLGTGSKKGIPRGTPLVQIDGSDCSKNDFETITRETFQSAAFQMPRRPPFLPDYLVINVEGYSESKGPPFFPNVDHMKDYVCLKPYTKEKDSKKKGKHVPKTRTQYPIEAAYVMTAFKGIGATHERTIAKLNGMFHKPGLFLVACTRVKHPKHLHIPPDHWPHLEDLTNQRLQTTVLESENLDRVVRAKSAKEMRQSKYYHAIPNYPLHIHQDIVNSVADLVHENWSIQGNNAKHSQSVQQNIKSLVLQKCDILTLNSEKLSEYYDEIVAFMKTTDEAKLLKKVPHLDYRAATAAKLQNKRKKRRINANAGLGKSNSAITKYEEVSKELIKGGDSLCSPLAEGNKVINTIRFDQFTTPLYRFINTGNTCYINSSLHMFLSLDIINLNPGARHNDQSQNDQPLTEENIYEIKCKVDVALEFDEITKQPPGSLIEPSSFCDAFFELNKTNIRRGMQEDLCEAAFPALLTNIHLFDPVKFESKMKKSFTCSNCSGESVLDVSLPYLILHPPSHDDLLQNIIGYYIEPTVIDKYCTDCNTSHDTTAHETFTQLPDVLILQLSRFTVVNGCNIKNTHKVNLEPYQVYLPEKDVNGKITEVQYELHSAISHLGSSSNCGHYIAHRKLDNNIWVKCNDENITTCLISNIKPEDVYVLAFKRIQDSMTTDR